MQWFSPRQTAFYLILRSASLCNLCVLCVAVVDEFRAKTHHRDAENTEVAQRIVSGALGMHQQDSQRDVAERKNPAKDKRPRHCLRMGPRVYYAADDVKHSRRLDQ